MIRRTIDQLLTMVEGELLIGDPSIEIAGVSTDSRAKQSGRLFVPLVGDRYDAHMFVTQAIEQGAVAALWQKGRPLPSDLDPELALIGVEDTLLALQQLAKAYRKTLRATVIGVTGSNGKTSTKDLIASVLSEQFQVQKTQGNLNNHIGLPLMVLSLQEDTEVAVLEMGMSGLGEIRLLCEIAAPHIGVITNIGEAHIEYLGTRARIADAKFELIESLPHDGTAFLFGDEPLLRQLLDKSPCPVLWFGFSDNNDIQAVNVQSKGLAGTGFKVAEEAYSLSVPGIHQVGNALAAIGIAKQLGMSTDQIRLGLEQASLSGMRMEVTALPTGGYVVNDAYNASPTSMKAALQLLSETTDTDYKIAVLGDMLELGDIACEMHQEVGRMVGKLKLDALVLIGKQADNVAAGARRAGMEETAIYLVESKQQAIDQIRRLASEKQHPVILVKASRGMRMEEIVSGLLA